MIPIKNDEEIKIMADGGKITSGALKKVLENVSVGITLLELDKIAEDYIKSKGGESSFMTVDGYDYTTCINVNEGLVHGLPNSYKIKSGDLVSIDLGALYKGFHTDLSYTVEVDSNKEEEFLKIGKKALAEGIKHATIGNRVGSIGNGIQKVVEKAGYSVSRDLVGHGIGRGLHEPPYVPGFGKRRSGPKIKAGMAFAVEVIYQKGNPEILVENDDWTIRTADGSLSGLFEKTVVTTKNGPFVITEFE